ncbi:hypothetical protein IKQ26_03855, partial [bacterium]|nr:hypothetical protein [bacterium]
DLCIFNLSNFDYNGVIEITTDKELPQFLKAQKIETKHYFSDKLIYNTRYVPVTEDYSPINTYLIDVKDLKPFSLTKLTKEKINNKNSLKTTSDTIENDYIKVKIKEGKINITDKRNKKEYRDFISLVDTADIGDSYNFGALPYDIKKEGKIKSFKVEKKELFATLSLDFEIKIPIISTENSRSKTEDNCRFNLVLTLYNQAKHLEFRAKWKNKTKNHLLKLGFNLPKPVSSTLSEDLFGTGKRNFNPDFDVYSLIPAKKGTEIKLNTAPMQRFVSAQGVEIITKGINEYEVNKNTLYITLLRATGIISNPDNITRGTPAGPPIETPELQMIGSCAQDFALSFETEETEMFKRAEEFYKPTVSAFSDNTSHQFFETTNKNILVYGIKKRKKDLIIRLFNLSDKPQKTKFKADYELYSLNSSEEKPSLTDKNLKFSGFEIKTIMLKYKKNSRSKK